MFDKFLSERIRQHFTANKNKNITNIDLGLQVLFIVLCKYGHPEKFLKRFREFISQELEIQAYDDGDIS